MAEEGKHGMGGLFGGGAKPSSGEGASMSFMTQELSNVTTRLRVLEERYTNSRKKMQLVEENMLSNRKKVSDDVKIVHSELDEIKHTIREIENKIILIIKEVRLMAKKEDVDTMKRYVEMWEPVNFVTQGQVENITREIVEEMLASEKGKK